MVENRGTQIYLDELRDVSVMTFPRSTQTTQMQWMQQETQTEEMIDKVQKDSQICQSISTCTDNCDTDMYNKFVEQETQTKYYNEISMSTNGTMTDTNKLINATVQTDSYQSTSTDCKYTQTKMENNPPSYNGVQIQKIPEQNKFLLPNLISGTLLALAGIDLCWCI